DWNRPPFVSPDWRMTDMFKSKQPNQADQPAQPAAVAAAPKAWDAFGQYWVDAAQRSILFCDLLRRRSAQYYANKATAVPHVLNFDSEPVLDARSFDKPVNYFLVRVKPPAGVVLDPRKRPFVVIDPRAGHGP